ncbi:MAG: helix-turn-helix transcriptional regulator [Nitrospinales bacterium]
MSETLLDGYFQYPLYHLNKSPLSARELLIMIATTIGWSNLASKSMQQYDSGFVRAFKGLRLHESESNFRALVENAHDGIVVLTNDGCACYANRRACEFTGYCKDELTAADFGDLTQRDDRSQPLHWLQMMLAGEQQIGCIEARLTHKQGEKLWFELSVSKTLWNKQPAVLVIFKDITERKCTQEALVSTCAELNCRVEKQASELKNSVRELDRKRKEFSLLKIEGEKINNELLETNNAISILARNINDHRLEAGKSVANAIHSRIMPVVDSLRNLAKTDEIQSGLDILDMHLQTLGKELRGEMNTMANLTPSELQVATMIKNGLKSREIAEKFYISLQTVKTHRRNIRKKLNIKSPNTSLASYLRFMMG